MGPLPACIFQIVPSVGKFLGKKLKTMETGAADMRKLEKLKKSRTGKKGYITKRINQLHGMVEAGGCSRGEMKRLMDKLVAVFEELENLCEEIMDISLLHDVSDDNLNNVEDIRFNIDSCVARVTEHIESRQGEAPSSGSHRTSSSSIRTSKWVETLPDVSSNALEGYESSVIHPHYDVSTMHDEV